MQEWIDQLQAEQSLSAAQCEALFTEMLGGSLEASAIEAILLALKTKGESIDEIIGAARAMRALMIPFEHAPLDAMDVCGTGGDGLKTYNISTTVAFVLAACGVPIVKHGNRAVSSASGSTDVLSALGAGLCSEPDKLARCLERANICYLAAPLFHPMMKHVAPTRAKLKSRTIFNVLGPLCNPACPKFQLMGVYDESLCTPIAQVLAQLGSIAAAVVHGKQDGLDELSISGASRIAQLLEGDILSYDVSPEQAGLPLHPISALVGGDSAHNAAALLRVLEGEQGAYRDAVLLNAAGALVVADKVDDPQSGVALAAEAIDSGRACEMLARFIEYSQ